MQPHSARHFYFILDRIPERAEVGDQFQPLTFAMQINLDKWIKYIIVISTLSLLSDVMINHFVAWNTL